MLPDRKKVITELKAKPYYGIAVHILKVSIAVVIIGWLLISGKIDVTAIRHVLSPYSIAICWGALFLSYVITSYRWKTLLGTQGIEVTGRDAYRLTLVGVFFSYILPGGVSGDVVKAYYVARDNVDLRWKVGVSVVIDRFIGMAGLILLSFFMLVFDWQDVVKQPQLISMQIFLGSLLMVLIFLGAVIFSENFYFKMTNFLRGIDVRFGEKPMRFFEACHAYGAHRSAIVKCLALSFAGHILAILVFVHVGDFFPDAISLAAYFYCVPVALILSSIPIAPGGIGVGQAAFYLIFNLYLGRVTDLGPTLVTVYQLIIFTFGLFGAFYYLQIKRRNSVVTSQEESQGNRTSV